MKYILSKRNSLIGFLFVIVILFFPKIASAQVADELFIQKSEIPNVVRLSGGNPPTIHSLSVFKDANSDGKRNSSEDCLNRNVTYEFTRLNGTKFERSIWGCVDDVVFITKARTITIKLKAVEGFKFTGLNFTDRFNDGAVRVDGRHSQKVTGDFIIDTYFTSINFGVKKQ